MRGSPVLLILACMACEREPARSPPEETPVALVIPPLAKDAGAAPAPVVHVGPVEVFPAAPLVPARDPRMVERRPRSRALVLSDVQTAESTLASTPAGAARSALRKQAADGHAELAYTSRGDEAVHARTEVVKQLVAIQNEDPSFREMPSVLYYLGLAHEALGDARSARRCYYDLIARFPGSDLIPLAYFGFGELFAAEASADPAKHELAIQAFKEVLKHPKTPVRADALLRIGQAQLQLKERNEARATFGDLRRTYGGSQAAAQIPAGF